MAAANEEAVRAWDTVLYERWKSNRAVFVGALAEVTEDVFELFPAPAGGWCIDIGCGFGETTRRLAELVGPGGFASGPIPRRGSSPTPGVRPSRRGSRTLRSRLPMRRRRSGIPSTTTPSRAWGRSSSPRRFRPCARSAAHSTPPAGSPRSAGAARPTARSGRRPEQVVERFLSRPDEYEADTCGPGPFSLGNPETTRGILEAAGFDEIETAPA